MDIHFRLIPVKKKEEEQANKKIDLKYINASELLKQNLSKKEPQSAKKKYNSWSDPSYENALKIKKQLIQEHQGASLEDVIDGELIKNEFGTCYRIKTEYPINFIKTNEPQCTQKILSSLKLVYGIGPHYEAQLKNEGYVKITDLLTHSKWGISAKQFIQMFELGDINGLHEWMWRFYPKSHPLIYLSSGFFKPQDFLVFDIETMGLFEAPIILFGIGKQKKNEVETRQYLLTDISDEPAALLETYKELSHTKALISYNGRSFDIPYLKDRLAFYGLDIIEEPPHFDLLHFTRRFIGEQLPSCTLTNVENHLGVVREIDLPSSLVPTFYETYLNTGNPGPLIPIIEHNKHDIITLVSLFNKFHEMLA